MGFLENLLKRFGGNTLYFRGCLSRKVAPELGENYAELLREIGIDFIDLGEKELCCASPAHSVGYEKDTKDLAEKNRKIFEEHNVTKVICSCPGCARMIKSYADLIGYKVEVRHITEVLLDAVKKGKLKRSIAEKVTFHDPCHLGRHMGIFDAPRELLKSAGCEIAEMDETKEKSFCCGGGGGLKSNHPEIAEKMAQERIRQAEETGAKTLVSACPLCYLHLKDNSKGVDVKDICHLLKRR